MSEGTAEVCRTCGQVIPPSDGHSGAEITALRERAGVDIPTLAKAIGDANPRTLGRIEKGTSTYPIGLYARCEEACRSIVSSRAAALGLELAKTE